MLEDRLNLVLGTLVELLLGLQRLHHVNPGLASEASKQWGAVLLVLSNVVTEALVLPPVLLLVVPAAVIETVAAAAPLEGRGGTAWLLAVPAQGGVG